MIVFLRKICTRDDSSSLACVAYSFQKPIAITVTDFLMLLQSALYGS